MLIREFKFLFVVVMGVALSALPAIASSRDHDHDSDREKEPAFVADFDLAVLDDGTIEASLMVDARSSISSVEIRSDELVFGPIAEVTPGLWVANAVAMDGAECYRATVEMVMDSKFDERDKDRHERKKARGDHAKDRRDRDEADDDDEHGDDAFEGSSVMRLGAGVCVPMTVCETPTDPPYVPGPGPGRPPGASPVPPMLPPLGMFP